MACNKTMGLIFANKYDKILPKLTAARAIGSVPFYGRYRMIDFPLSSMVHAGIIKVGVITKNNYQSLMDHIGSGKAWGLSRKNEGLYLLSPYGMEDTNYEGRVASLSGLVPFIQSGQENRIIMADCHVVGNIRYDRLLEAHSASGADITVAYKTGQPPNIPDVMTLKTAKNGQVREMLLGNPSQSAKQYGIGLYVVERDWLVNQVLNAYSHNRMSFERDIVQEHVKTGKVIESAL